MRVDSVSRVSFSGKIIDSHGHIGKWGSTMFEPESLDIFTNSTLLNGDEVEKIIASNSSCIDNENILDELAGNKQMLEYSYRNPKIAPLAVCQPKLTKGDTTKIEQLLTENQNKFVGFKFHPKCMELPADDASYDNYMKLAKKYKLPCLFHSDKTYDVVYGDGSIGQRCEYSRPEQIYSLAKRHSDVPVILAHMGGNEGDNAQKAIDVIIESIEKGDANLYADISWVNADTVDKPDIVKAIKRLQNTSKGDKTDRLLFGTDAPLGEFGHGGINGVSPKEAYSNLVVNIKKSIKDAFNEQEADEIIDKIFYKNAKNLFFKDLNDTSEVSKNVKKSVLSLKNAAIALGIVGLVGAMYKFLNHKFTSPNKKG